MASIVSLTKKCQCKLLVLQFKAQFHANYFIYSSVTYSEFFIRDQNQRKNCWQSRNENTYASINDDLRSPCHKQPRFKGQKDGTPTDRPRSKGTWNKKIDSRESNSNTVFKKDEFPPLGFNLDR